MAAQLTFAMYRPKKGKSAQLKKILKDHVPTLHKLELITKKSSHIVESENGTIIEIFEWTSVKAKDIAHKHPAVRAIWGKMMDICTFPPMEDLPEAKHSFPNFKILKSSPKK